MKYRKILAMGVLLAGIGMGGCQKREAHSKLWFDAHPADAVVTIKNCREGKLGGEECSNADVSVQEAAGKARFKKFLGS